MRFWWLGFSALLSAGDWDWTLDSDRFLAWERDPAQEQGSTSLSQRLRLNLDGQLSPLFSWEFAYEVQGIQRQRLASLFLPVFLRVDDLKQTLHQEPDTLFLQQLDRLNIVWTYDEVQVTLGRQAVGHGNGRFFNPSDVFAPLTPFSLNSQYKAGIDGIKVNRSFGSDSEAAIMAFFPESGDGLLLARLATNLRGVDMSLLAGRTYGEWTLAWDFAGTWRGAAWYTEGIWRRGNQRDDPWRLMAGLSHRFGSALDVTLEASYHNLGGDNPLQAFLLTPEWRHGEMFLLRERHLGLGCSYELTPLVRLNVVTLAEFAPGSAWLQAGLDWDVRERATLRVGALIPAGGSETEFGSYSDGAFVEYRLTLP